MALSAGPRRGVLAEINVTPMADVMIVLLIIFMVMVPLIRDHDRVRLPEATRVDEAEGGPPVVVVHRDASLALANRTFDPATLRARLQEQLDALPPERRLVHLRADEGVAFSAIQAALGLCREAGAETVTLLARRKVG